METSVLGPSRSDPKSNQVVNYINCHQACLSLIISPSSSSSPCCPGLAVGGHEAERLLADLPRRVPEGAALLQPTGEEQDRQLHHCYHHYCTFDIVNDIVKNIIENSTSLQEAVTHDPSLTFWTYLLVRTVLGVLTAARFLIMIIIGS